MSVRLHTTTKYQVEYGSTISQDLTDKIIDLCYDAEGGWVSEDETEMEIPLVDLEKAIAETTDEEMKVALQLIYDESDKENDFARLSLF